MIIDFSKLTATSRYNIMKNTITPRPIAWIVTQQGSIINIAPFSYFSPISSNPPMVMVSIGLKDDKTPKDTRRNILQTKKATICFVEEADLDDMVMTATALSAQESEAQQFNILTKRLIESFPPIIASTKAALFCQFSQECPIEGSETLPLFLEIKHAWYDEGVFDNEHLIHLENVGRLGDSYRVGGFEIKL